MKSDKLTFDELRQKISRLDKIPSVASILRTLLKELDRPPDQVKLDKVVELISSEESMVAKCLHLANSPLFGQAGRVSGIRAAVLLLGVVRLRDVLVSSCLMNAMPKFANGMPATVFWEHSLACALSSRHLAKQIGFPDADKAYLAGLLHDIGQIVNVIYFPEELQRSLAFSGERGVPIEVAEREIMGFTHCETGWVLAQEWSLPPDVQDVILHHHQPERELDHADLTAIVNLADKLCFIGGITYAPVYAMQLDILDEPAWSILLERYPQMQTFDLARLGFELESHFGEVREVVASLFRV
ncbi:MAG: HDOD domain-containing protein [Acidobacteriia bacterium]|nr:HDOD domain-containing protein [Terriglobia bacterium]